MLRLFKFVSSKVNFPFLSKKFFDFRPTVCVFFIFYFFFFPLSRIVNFSRPDRENSRPVKRKDEGRPFLRATPVDEDFEKENRKRIKEKEMVLGTKLKISKKQDKIRKIQSSSRFLMYFENT